MENASTINFPKFQFQTERTDQILSVSCQHLNVSVPVGPCPAVNGKVPDLRLCVGVSSDLFYATNKADVPYSDNRLSCLVLTNTSAKGNTALNWALQGPDTPNFGTLFGSVWVNANNNAWIMLDKSVATGNGGSLSVSWSSKLLYHSSQSQVGTYWVSAVIDNFIVYHSELTQRSSGWVTTAEIGGFGYFLLILHTLVMIGVGIHFVNDSTFLKQ